MTGMHEGLAALRATGQTAEEFAATIAKNARAMAGMDGEDRTACPVTGMDLYVVMVNDRHTDPEPYLFATADEAIDYARRMAHKYAWRPEDVVESDIEGWLYHADYSSEGDSVWVLAKTVGAEK